VSRVLVPSVVAAVLTTALLAGGCGGVDAPPSAAEHRTPGAEPMASATAGQTRPSTPHPTGEHRSREHRSRDGHHGQAGDGGRKIAPTQLPVARADGSRQHLLDAATLPAYAEGVAWTIRATGPERTRPVGACQKATFVDIGAMHAVRRAFAGPEDSGLRVRQVVARFADAKSAWRAHEVLRSWRDGCEEWLDAPHPDVSPMEDVETDAGDAGRYRAVYGPKTDTDASGLGIVRKGRWVSIVALTADADDFAAGWTRRAVRRIAATF